MGDRKNKERKEGRKKEINCLLFVFYCYFQKSKSVPLDVTTLITPCWLKRLSTLCVCVSVCPLRRETTTVTSAL
jgi:hypothetical protein